MTHPHTTPEVADSDYDPLTCARPAPPLPPTLDAPDRSFAVVATEHTVFVGIPSRQHFDRLALPAQDHGLKMALDLQTLRSTDQRRLLVKMLECDGFRVVFQHWGRPVPTPTAAGAAA